MNKKILFLILSEIFILPSIALGQNLYRPASPVDLASLAQSVETAIWIIFGGVAVVMFVVAGILFLTAQGDPEKVKTARSAFIWGIAGVVVGIVAYSIVAIVGIAIGV